MKVIAVLFLCAVAWALGKGILSLDGVGEAARHAAVSAGGALGIPPSRSTYATEMPPRVSSGMSRTNGCVDLERRVFTPLAAECGR